MRPSMARHCLSAQHIGLMQGWKKRWEQVSDMRKILLPAVALAFASVPFISPPAAWAQSISAAPSAQGCTFQSLSQADKRRYQSRYRRRVRVDGQAYADRWLYQQVCMTAEQRKALRPPAKGKNCRAVSRPVTSMDGSMTVGIGRVCDK
jgi:hypothetical protein